MYILNFIDCSGNGYQRCDICKGSGYIQRTNQEGENYLDNCGCGGNWLVIA